LNDDVTACPLDSLDARTAVTEPAGEDEGHDTAFVVAGHRLEQHIGGGTGWALADCDRRRMPSGSSSR
jgi:hypothetical protein